MKLDIKERLLLDRVIPQKGPLTEQMIVFDLLKKVVLTDDEKKRCNFQVINSPDGQAFTKWDSNKDVPKEIIFTDVELRLLKDGVERLDKDGAITQDIIALILKIKEEKNADTN